MPITQTIIKAINENSDIITKTILPRFKEKYGIISIGTAATLTLVYFVLQKINKPSSKLRHLPYVSLYTFLSYAFRGELYEDYSKKQIMPLFKNGGSNGVYVRPNVISWYVQLANPVAVKQLLLKQESLFPKTKINLGKKQTLIARFIGGPNIVFLSGDDWKRHRKIANPAFQRSMPVNSFGQLTRKMYHTIENDGNTVDVLNLFERWTLDAIGIAGFDFDFNAVSDKNSKWVRYYDSVKEGMSNPFFIFFPSFDSTYVHWFEKRKERHDNLTEFLNNIDKIIEEKRQIVYENIKNSKQEEEKDLLTLMIESELREDGEKLSNEELRSNLCIFFLAGHDTTANTLAFALYELAIHPELQEKAREEAIRILGDKPEDVLPTVDQTKEMDYINMIIKETLRRHTPVYNMTGRVCQEDVELAGNFIPKGTEIAVDVYNLHHNPDVWKDPYTFDPERFAPGGEADNQKGIAWVPFSNGGRQCIGMNFSLAEQRVVLSMMLRKYKWTLPKNSPHQERLQKKGIAWGLVITDDPLDITFEKRY